MGELTSIVSLNRFGSIAKVNDRPFGEIYGGVTALFLVSVDKPFSGCLVDHRVLKEFVSICTNIAGSRNIFHIHLPLDAQFFWCVIASVVLGFLLCGCCLCAVSQTDKYPVE